MSMTADKSAPNSLGEGLKMLSAKWGWIVALGIVFMIAGVVALGSVVAATESAVLIVGIMMIMGGAAELFAAFSVKSWGKFAFWLLLGALYVAAGIIAILNPFAAATILTLMLGPPRTGGLFLSTVIIGSIGIGAYLVNSTRHLARNPKAVGRFVLRSIAVLTLFDAGIMAFFWAASPTADARFVAGIGVLVAIACFFLVRWSHRRIAGT